jgi:hypothetical protein
MRSTQRDRQRRTACGAATIGEADNGITEVEVYRGFGWGENSDQVPKGITWGPKDDPSYGVTDVMPLNPFSSFSADINVSQGTGAGNGFAGGGFGSGGDYSLLIGARIPVDRILGKGTYGHARGREDYETSAA